MCLQPIRIKNQYTDEYMFVACRKCDECRIDNALLRTAGLANDMAKFGAGVFVTLTYDNSHLPYVLQNSDKIYRGLENPLEIGCVDNIPQHVDIKPKNFPFSATAVLNYSDVQKFLKRFRQYYVRNYGKKYAGKYFVCGEYGTFGKRPHYHVVFYGQGIDFDEIKNATLGSWQLCDWDRLDLDKCFELSLSGCASYVASYVNCCANLDGIFLVEEFKPKTARSKDTAFGISNKIFSTIQEIENKPSFGVCAGRYGSPFISRDCSRFGVFTSRLVPTRVLRSLYPSPSGAIKDNFNAFRRRCFQIYRCFENGKYRGDEPSYYLFNLGYRKYLSRNNLKDTIFTFDNYVFDNYRARSLYASSQLRLWMESYEDSTPDDYILSASNTHCDNVVVRSLYLETHLSKDAFKKQKLEDMVFCPRRYKDIEMYPSKFDNYHGKLLPKHLNSLLTNYYG